MLISNLPKVKDLRGMPENRRWFHDLDDADLRSLRIPPHASRTSSMLMTWGDYLNWQKYQHGL